MDQNAIAQRLEEGKVATETTCKHHWLIEPPTGPASHGQCKRCGAERVFVNSTDESVSVGKK